jgi:hypothetical protein
VLTSGTIHRVALVKTDVSEESNASIIRVKLIVNLGAMLLQLLATDNVHSSTILTTATRRNIPEYGIIHTHRRENLKSYIALTGWAL